MKKSNRWNLVKGFLIVLAHILAVIIVISMIWILRYPGAAQGVLEGQDTKDYQNSRDFEEKVFSDSVEILEGIQNADLLGLNGGSNEKKIVDIEDYAESGDVSGSNESGLAYYLGDLIEWHNAYVQGRAGDSDDGDEPADPIVVCQKPDGMYEYFYYSDFKNKVEQEKLVFSNYSDIIEIFGKLKSQSMYEDENDGMIQDYDGNIVYTSYWSYDGFWREELYAPVGAENILDIVNKDPHWNGRLTEAFYDIRTTMDSLGMMMEGYREFQDTWEEGNTNLTYLYADKSEGKVYTNCGEYEMYAGLEKNLKFLREKGKYVIVRPRLADFDSNMDGINASQWKEHVKQSGVGQGDYVFAIGVDTSYPIQDNYYELDQFYQQQAPYIRTALIAAVLSALLWIAILIWLTVMAGRRFGDEELHLNFFDRLKTEVAAAAAIGAWGAGLSMLNDIWWIYNYDLGEGIAMAFAASFTCAMFLVGYLSLVRRIKAGTLWKNSLILWIWNFGKTVASHMRCSWKTGLSFGGFAVLHWVAFASGNGFAILIAVAAEVYLCIYLLQRAVGRQKIRQGIERIAAGEVDYQIPLYGLKGEQMEIAQRVNAIGEGLDAALEASMKDERLKTDLITNVSHDIKTPLTSIINYIDLLKRENFTDPKVKGYLDVLEAKAQRLKTLTEDVVEASKVSSGNISLEYMIIDLKEMIQQASGEFEEKFKKRGLKEIVKLPDEEAVIRADGRRLWRVLENIYNNAAKYALEGTRVYVDITVSKTEVFFSLKNISEQPLNINADELTERFVRGDVSRSTEGSGLGLSIAKSLIEMQGGRFTLYLDGDLFRVTIIFPRMVRAEQ